MPVQEMMGDKPEDLMREGLNLPEALECADFLERKRNELLADLRKLNQCVSIMGGPHHGQQAPYCGVELRMPVMGHVFTDKAGEQKPRIATYRLAGVYIYYGEE